MNNRGALLAALYLLGLTQIAAAQQGHRMGGIAGNPSELFKQDEQDDHHTRHHGNPPDTPHEFSFGRRLPNYDVDVRRFIEIDLRDGAWKAPRAIRVKTGDIVRFELRNVGSVTHEFRLGDPEYQREHALMLQEMPSVDHLDSNAVRLEPGRSRSMVWQFGSEAVVELACHQPGHYLSGEVVTVVVEP